MRTISRKFIVPLLLCVVFAFSTGLELPSNMRNSEANSSDEMARIFKQNCSISGCHKGVYPQMNLNLEQDKFLSALLNISSQELRQHKLVDTENPEKSYLLLKIKGDKTIIGKRMPLDAPPLYEEEIEAIKNWIYSLKEAQEKKEGTLPQKEGIPALKKAEEKREFRKPAFWGTRVINLPTTRSIGKGRILFRISHRYFSSVKDGYDAFYGLDGPAAILLSLGYGFTDNLSLTLARSNRFKETEFSLKWIIFEQRKNSALPFSAAINIGGSLVTQSQPGKKTFRSENMKLSLQLSLSHQVSNSLSFLLVPAYSSNANHWEALSEGTFALGAGARYMFLNDFSLILEWIPVLTGYKANSSGWGFGLEKKIGGHVFQVFVLNTIGLTSAQYVPGGDLRLKDSDFRIGFNIFRRF